MTVFIQESVRWSPGPHSQGQVACPNGGTAPLFIPTRCPLPLSPDPKGISGSSSDPAAFPFPKPSRYATSNPQDRLSLDPQWIISPQEPLPLANQPPLGCHPVKSCPLSRINQPIRLLTYPSFLPIIAKANDADSICNQSNISKHKLIVYL